MKISRVSKLVEIMQEGYFSFKYFAEKIVKEIEGTKIEIPEFQREWARAALKYQNVVIAAARGHGKTIMMGVLLPLYIATYNSNKSILILSPTENRAYEILQKIRYCIENNTFLKFLKPPIASGTWTKTKLDTSNHCQFYCKCMSPNIRGYHLNYLLIEEAGQIFDIETFLSAVLPTTFSKKGKCIAIGTPYSHLDLLARLKNNPHFHYLEYPAINKDGTLLWPERFTLTDLKVEKRKIGATRFEREYLLNILAEENQAFPATLILPNLRDDMSFLEYGDANKNYFIGVDLAYSPKGDYSVFIVFEQLEDGGYAIVSLDRMRGLPPSTQETKLLDLCMRFKPKRVVVDKSLFGQTIVNNLRSLNVPVEGFDFAAGRRGMIMFTLQRLFSDRKLQIPNSEKVKPKIRILLKELKFIRIQDGKFKTTIRHDDLVIATCLAAYAASKYKSCLVYGISNVSNINTNYDYEYKRSYKEQMEKNLQQFSKYKK